MLHSLAGKRVLVGCLAVAATMSFGPVGVAADGDPPARDGRYEGRNAVPDPDTGEPGKVRLFVDRGGRRVKRIDFTGIPFRCGEQRGGISSIADEPLKIGPRGRFRLDYQGSNETLEELKMKIRGRFITRRRVRGWFEGSGRVWGAPIECTMERMHFSARFVR